MTPNTRPALFAQQLAKLLDEDPGGPHHDQVARLVTLAHLLATVGQLAHRRAHDQSPGIRAGNTDPRGTGLGDPTATTALNNLDVTDDDTVDLDHQLRSAIVDLDTTTRRLTHLIAQAVTVHRTDPRPTTECGEALCTEAAQPGRLGYCETDYRRRLRWAEKNHGTTAPDWDSTENETPRQITKAERLGIHEAPPLTSEQLAERAIRKRRTAV